MVLHSVSTDCGNNIMKIKLHYNNQIHFMESCNRIILQPATPQACIYISGKSPVSMLLV